MPGMFDHIAASAPVSKHGIKPENLIARAVDWILGYDFFVSCSHGDGMQLPQRIKERLEQAGFRLTRFLSHDRRWRPAAEGAMLRERRPSMVFEKLLSPARCEIGSTTGNAAWRVSSSPIRAVTTSRPPG